MNMFTDSSLVVDNQLYKKFELSKKFLVLGAGVSGQACTKWLEENQKIVTIVDSRALKNKKIEGSKITIITEKNFPLSDSWFKQVDFVVASPGLSPHIAKKVGWHKC